MVTIDIGAVGEGDNTLRVKITHCSFLYLFYAVIFLPIEKKQPLTEFKEVYLKIDVNIKISVPSQNFFTLYQNFPPYARKCSSRAANFSTWNLLTCSSSWGTYD